MNWNSKVINDLEWASGISNLEEKQKVAMKIADRVKDGETIGFGSGSTSFLAIQAIGEKIKNNGLKIKAITTSHEMQMNCIKLGIDVVSILHAKPDWCFDGADEVDPSGNLIKGRGGAMFKEKLVIASSPVTYILVDQSKFVKKLGEKFAVPVEVVPLALNGVESFLTKIGAIDWSLRMATGKDGPIISENGNLIMDVKFKEITPDHESLINQIPGVLDNGLFIGYNVEILST